MFFHLEHILLFILLESLYWLLQADEKPHLPALKQWPHADELCCSTLPQLFVVLHALHLSKQPIIFFIAPSS